MTRPAFALACLVAVTAGSAASEYSDPYDDEYKPKTRGGYSPPSYSPPSYPSYSPPSYSPPKYSPPSYSPPKYSPPKKETVYSPPSYSPPSYDPPSYKAPSYQPSYEHSSYDYKPKKHEDGCFHGDFCRCKNYEKDPYYNPIGDEVHLSQNACCANWPFFTEVMPPAGFKQVKINIAGSIKFGEAQYKEEEAKKKCKDPLAVFTAQWIDRAALAADLDPKTVKILPYPDLHFFCGEKAPLHEDEMSGYDFEHGYEKESYGKDYKQSSAECELVKCPHYVYEKYSQPPTMPFCEATKYDLKMPKRDSGTLLTCIAQNEARVNGDPQSIIEYKPKRRNICFKIKNTLHKPQKEVTAIANWHVKEENAEFEQSYRAALTGQIFRCGKACNKGYHNKKTLITGCVPTLMAGSAALSQLNNQDQWVAYWRDQQCDDLCVPYTVKTAEGDFEYRVPKCDPKEKMPKHEPSHHFSSYH